MMTHLLDMLFRFPADKTANPEFIDLFLNLLKTPTLVLDRKFRRRMH